MVPQGFGLIRELFFEGPVSNWFTAPIGLSFPLQLREARWMRSPRGVQDTLDAWTRNAGALRSYAADPITPAIEFAEQGVPIREQPDDDQHEEEYDRAEIEDLRHLQPDRPPGLRAVIAGTQSKSRDCWPTKPPLFLPPAASWQM